MPIFRTKAADVVPDKTFDLHRTLPNLSALPATEPGSNRRNWKKIVKRSLLILLFVIIGVGGWLGYKFYENSSKIFGGNLLDWFSSTRLQGEADGRVNFLLIGYSADDPGHGGATLTDSIMVVSLNTKNNKAFLMSVPRDLYVNIPGHGYAKINEAYQDGERDRPGSGPALLESVIQSKLGLKMNYYALINYTAFRDTVNAVGGISVNIQSSDPRGLFDGNIAKADGGPLKLSNGWQQLDGQTALNLARARGDSSNSYGFPASDFDRTNHQRQMLIALKDKAISAGTLSNPIKISNLLDALGSNVKTDLSLAEVRRLYSLAKNLDSQNIASANINGPTDKRLLVGYQTSTGQSALIPAAGLNNYSAIQAYVAQLLASN